MHSDLEAQILARWPDWFPSQPDISQSLMQFGFQCSDGWFSLIVSTFETIASHVTVFNAELAKIGTHFEILEVTEKFGELRIVAMPANYTIVTAFLDARAHSPTVCEVCGALGHLIAAPDRLRCERCDKT